MEQKGYFDKEEIPDVKVSPLKDLTGVFIGDSITEVNFRTSKTIINLSQNVQV